MADTGNTFGLDIPEQLGSEQDGFDLRPKKLDEWLEALPLADINESTHQVQTVLAQVNRRPISPQARFRFLERVCEPVAYLTASLEKSITGRNLPLTAKGLRTADRISALLAESAAGYKIIVAEILSSTRRKDKKLLAYSIHRATRLLSRILLSAYQLYTPHPRRVWRELHLLYYYAELKKLADLQLSDEKNAGSRAPSIANTYKHTLLVALADPYRLRQGEVEQVYRASNQWTRHAQLFASGDTGGRHDGLFRCRLDTDIPPRPLPPETADEHRYCRLLDLSRLTAKLRMTMAQLREGSDQDASAQSIPHSLLRRLLIAWEIRTKRNFSRAWKTAPIRVAIGLNATHHLIGSGDAEPEPPETTAPAAMPAQPPLMDPLIDTHTEFSIAPRHSDAEQYHANWIANSPATVRMRGHSDQAGERVSIPEPAYQAHTWKTVNISAGGYCLIWNNDTPSPAQVGELVGIHEDDGRQGTWSIGVVRWMQYRKNQGIKLGIQILAPNATAVSTQPRRKKGNGAHAFSCLELPEIKTMGQAPTLLTPALHHKVGDTLLVNDHGRISSVQLTQQLENTGNFARFQFTTVDPGATAACFRKSDPKAASPEEINAPIGPVPVL